MEKSEFLNLTDDLLVHAWEMRDHLIKVARNETWDMIHQAPYRDRNAAINLANAICKRFTMQVKTAESLAKRDIPHLDILMDKLIRSAMDDYASYITAHNHLEKWKIEPTGYGSYRKSPIRK